MNLSQMTMKVLLGGYRKLPFRASLTPQLSKLLSFIVNNLSISKKVFPYKTVDGFEMYIDLTQFIDSQIYYTGRFESKTVSLLKSVLKPGDKAIDVGANIGYLTLVMSQIVGSNGQVFAFEPSPWAFNRLQNNLALNNIEWVKAEQAGVSDTSQQGVKMSVPNGYPLDRHDSATSETVDVINLDDYFKQLSMDAIDSIRLIKVDTDGWEACIFRGAYNVLERYHPILVFELGPTNIKNTGNDPLEMMQKLASLGYQFAELDSEQRLTNIAAYIEAIPPTQTRNIVARYSL